MIDQVNSGVAHGRLTNIVALTNPNAGGEYDPAVREMRLPLSRLTTPPSVGEMTFVLGHELQHGLNASRAATASSRFAQDVSQVASGHAPVHDYTTALQRKLAANRDDEARAQIAGWNAVAGAVRSQNPNPTLADIYQFQPRRMEDFIDRSPNGPPYTYAIKPNLTLAPDLTLASTAANIEGMGKNYFDKPPRQPGGLGPRGNADYVNYYGASSVGYIAQVERVVNPPHAGAASPQMTLDMARLRLSEKLLEEKGIDLGPGNTGQQRYFDSSAQPPVARIFQHTINSHQHVSPVLPVAVTPDFPRDHADRRLYDAIQRQLPPGTSAEMTAHALARTRECGIRDEQQLDKVAVHDGNAWVVGKTPGFWTKVDLAATPPPLQESLRAVDIAAVQEVQQVTARHAAMTASPVLR
ncbi:XVIPCD domain-containing protein [Lysobacter fragariae]